ncbi:MAG: hypothetical protein IJU65_04305, partial [Desulfovibrio sp.]|nr:hypothetical protein [Desulfovibrio sp.]
NIAEKLNDITAPGFVRFDAPLPSLGVSSDLVQTELQKMGGVMEVPADRAKKFGGPVKYFSRKQPYIIKQAGMDAEKQIVLKNEAARKNKHLRSVITRRLIHCTQCNKITMARFDAPPFL